MPLHQGLLLPSPTDRHYMKGSATIPSERHDACEKSVAIRSLPFRAPSSGWGGTPLAVVTMNVGSTYEVSPQEQCGAVYTPTELPGGLTCTLTLDWHRAKCEAERRGRRVVGQILIHRSRLFVGARGDLNVRRCPFDCRRRASGSAQPTELERVRHRCAAHMSAWAVGQRWPTSKRRASSSKPS